MSDESRPFKGPYETQIDPKDEFGYWQVAEGDGSVIVSLLSHDQAEQLRLALELLELLPRIERYIEAGISMGDLNESMSLHAAIQALKEPRP